MPSNINIGQALRITVRFADFDVEDNTDEPLEPNSVTGELYLFNNTTSQYNLLLTVAPIIHTSTGVYHYDWTAPTNGKFKFVFKGTFPLLTPSTVINEQVFYVGTATPTIILQTTQEFNFLGELDPLYLDPIEVQTYFPSVNLVEATEIIYRLSTDLQTWFGENLVLTSVMHDWLLAATLCQLSKVHTYDGGMNGFGQSSSFQLGELQVARDTRNASRLNNNGLGLGQATTWCELAALLRNQLNINRTGPVSFVKGSSYSGGLSPIPPRAIRRFD